MESILQSRQFKVFIVVAAITLPIFLLSPFTEVFLLLVVSVVMTLILNPLVDIMEQKGLSRVLAILITFVVLFGGSGIGLWYAYPLMVEQIQTLSSRLETFTLAEKLSEIENAIASVFPFMKAEEIGIRINKMVADFVGQIEEQLSSVLAIALSMVIVPLVTFFLLKDYYNFQKAIIRNVPNKYFEMALNLMSSLETQLGKYIRGVAIESLSVALLYMIGYTIIGLNYPIMLGIVGGIFNIIPLAGPFIGAVPAVLVSIIQFNDLSMLVYIIGITVVVQQIDEMVIQPNVYGKILHIHPMLIIIIILLGGEIMGVMGMVLAIPIYTIIMVTAKQTNWGLKNYKITSGKTFA